MVSLSPLERETLLLFAQGVSPEKIGLCMQRPVHQGTIRTRLQRVRGKLGAPTNTAAVIVALKRGYIQLDDIKIGGTPPTTEGG